MLLGYIVLTTAYYSNVFNGRDLKWMSNSLFASDGSKYNQTAVIGSDYRLDQSALETVGLPRYTTTYAISQLCYNLSLGSAISTIILWHWRELRDGMFVLDKYDFPVLIISQSLESVEDFQGQK